MIKIYSKAGCGYCIKAKALLVQGAIAFEEIRVDLDSSARDFLIEKGHRSVPQLYIGDTLLVEGGFDGLKDMSFKQIREKVELYESRKK